MEPTTIARNEVDELLASMESTLGEAAPRPSTPLREDEARGGASTDVTSLPDLVTGSTKPTTPFLTSRTLSDRSVTRTPSKSSVLPSIAGASSPRARTPPASMEASPTPTPLSIPSDLPAEVDALAASLQVDVDVDDSVAMATEPSEGVALPPLLSSTSKSFSASMTHLSSDKRPQSSGELSPGRIARHISFGRLANVGDGDPGVPPQQKLNVLSPRDKSISKRRLTIGTHEISPHALERLGVNTDILKKEKGMKKLGISDVDLERSDELRKYSGIPASLQQTTKPEIFFGFTREQLVRVKAMNRLGTSEEEVMDEYSRRVSRLGTHEPPVLHSIK